MKPRRVIILCFNARPTPRQQNLFRLFQELDWQPAYVTWDRTGVQGSTKPLKGSQYQQVIHLAAPTESASLLLLMPKYWSQLGTILRKTIREDGGSIMVVATHVFHLPLAWRFWSVIWLYDVAEYFSLSISAYFGPLRLLIRPFIYLFEGLGILRMRAVIGVDSRRGWFKKYLKRFNSRVWILPNVPARADDPTLEEIRACAVEYDNRRVICYVGGIMERKGLDVALTALLIVKEKFPNVLLLLIGPLRGLATQLNTELARRGLEKNVRIIGFVPYREMLARIAGADVGIALYQPHLLYQKVGMLNARKIFTYMQAGLCVIAPRFGEIGLSVSTSSCGFLVETGKPADVAEALERIFSNKDLCADLKNNSRRAFEQKYNWELTSEQLKLWLMQSVPSV